MEEGVVIKYFITVDFSLRLFTGFLLKKCKPMIFFYTISYALKKGQSSSLLLWSFLLALGYLLMLFVN